MWGNRIQIRVALLLEHGPPSLVALGQEASVRPDISRSDCCPLLWLSQSCARVQNTGKDFAPSCLFLFLPEEREGALFCGLKGAGLPLVRTQRQVKTSEQGRLAPDY